MNKQHLAALGNMEPAPFNLAMFAPSADVVGDIVRWDNIGLAADDLKATIIERVKNEIEASGAKRKDAIASLRAALIDGGMDRRRASEALDKLGLKDEVKSETAKKAKKEKSEAEAAVLNPVIEKLIALAEAETGSIAEAVKALRRAYLSEQGKAAGKVAATEAKSAE